MYLLLLLLLLLAGREGNILSPRNAPFGLSLFGPRHSVDLDNVVDGLAPMCLTDYSL